MSDPSYVHSRSSHYGRREGSRLPPRQLQQATKSRVKGLARGPRPGGAVVGSEVAADRRAGVLEGVPSRPKEEEDEPGRDVRQRVRGAVPAPSQPELSGSRARRRDHGHRRYRRLRRRWSGPLSSTPPSLGRRR